MTGQISVVRWGTPEEYDFESDAPVHTAVIDLHDEKGDSFSLPGTGVLELGRRFRQISPSLLEADQFVIRTSSTSLEGRLANDPIIRTLVDGRPLAVLRRSSIGDQSRTPTLTVLDGGTGAVWPSFAEFSNAELSAILRRSGSIYEGDNHHYVLPSGVHANRFIRLGNSMRSIVDVRRWADWVIPTLDDNTDLLADTGALLPLLFEVQRYCQRKFGWDTKVEALGGYPTSDSIHAKTFDLQIRSMDSRQLQFVISVSSSGNSVGSFRAVKSDHDSHLVLCSTSSTVDPSALVRVSVDTWTPSADGSCASCGSPARITIHNSTYEPLFDFNIKSEPVHYNTAKEAAPLFELLSRNDAVRLHYADRVHHEVWIDSPKLLASEEATQLLRNKISELDPQPDLVLIPRGPAADLLAKVAQESLSAPVVRLPSGKWAGEVVSRIETADTVLVLDDAFVTGGTLIAIRRQVYQIAQKVSRSPEMMALVFVARPNTERKIQQIGRPYRTHRGVRFFSVFKSLLSGSDCSWCEEQRLLRHWLPALSPKAQKTAVARLAILDAELHEPVLLGGRADSIGLITPGSFFGTLGERAGFAAASSAALSTMDRATHEASAMNVRILDLPMVLDSYYDPIFVIGILRSIRAGSVRFANSDAQVIQRMTQMAAPDSSVPEVLRCELAWASLVDKVPLDVALQMLAPAESPDARMLEELVRMKVSGVAVRPQSARGTT
jgi:hypothetical protein